MLYLQILVLLVGALLALLQLPKFQRLQQQSSVSVYLVILFFALQLSVVVIQYMQDNAVKLKSELESYQGTLIAANDPTPASSTCPDISKPIFIPSMNKTISPVTDKSLYVFLGNNLEVVNEFPSQILKYQNGSSTSPIITIDKDSYGGILLTADIRDSENNDIIARISNNEFTINHNNILNMSRPDRSTLSVIDQAGNQVLSVRYLNPSAIRLLGTLYYAPHQAVEIKPDRMIAGRGNFIGMCQIGVITI